MGLKNPSDETDGLFAMLILKGFACLSAEELLIMACDQHGSFVMESFFKSEMIPQEKKAKLVKALLVRSEAEHYELCCT